MCDKAVEQMEVAGEDEGEEEEEMDIEAWAALEVGTDECVETHPTYRNLIGSDVCVLEVSD